MRGYDANAHEYYFEGESVLKLIVVMVAQLYEVMRGRVEVSLSPGTTKGHIY